jgi:hypothetical protein
MIGLKICKGRPHVCNEVLTIGRVAAIVDAIADQSGAFERVEKQQRELTDRRA